MTVVYVYNSLRLLYYFRDLNLLGQLLFLKYYFTVWVQCYSAAQNIKISLCKLFPQKKKLFCENDFQVNQNMFFFSLSESIRQIVFRTMEKVPANNYLWNQHLLQYEHLLYYQINPYDGSQKQQPRWRQHLIQNQYLLQNPHLSWNQNILQNQYLVPSQYKSIPIMESKRKQRCGVSPAEPKGLSGCNYRQNAQLETVRLLSSLKGKSFSYKFCSGNNEKSTEAVLQCSRREAGNPGKEPHLRWHKVALSPHKMEPHLSVQEEKKKKKNIYIIYICFFGGFFSSWTDRLLNLFKYHKLNYIKKKKKHIYKDIYYMVCVYPRSWVLEWNHMKSMLRVFIWLHCSESLKKSTEITCSVTSGLPWSLCWFN